MVKQYLIFFAALYLAMLPVGLALAIGFYALPVLPVIGWCEIRLLGALKKMSRPVATRTTQQK